MDATLLLLSSSSSPSSLLTAIVVMLPLFVLLNYTLVYDRHCYHHSQSYHVDLMYMHSVQEPLQGGQGFPTKVSWKEPSRSMSEPCLSFRHFRLGGSEQDGGGFCSFFRE